MGSWVESDRGSVSVQRELIEVLHARKTGRRPSDSIQACLCHLVQTGTLEHCAVIARAEGQVVERGSLSVGIQAERVWQLDPVLVNGECQCARSRIFQVHSNFEQVWFGRFPGERQRRAGGGLLVHAGDAESGVAQDVQLIFAAHDQGGLVVGRQRPFSRVGREQVVARTLPIVEAPFAAHHAGEFSGGQRGQRLLEHQAALGWIGGQRQFEGPVLRVDVQFEVVSQFSAKHQRRTLRGEDQTRLLRAHGVSRVDLAQSRHFGRADGRQGHHHDRFGIAEGWRKVQSQVKGVFGGQSQSGDVLKVRGMQRSQDFCRVDDGAYIGAVHAPSTHAGVAELVHQVAGGSVGDLAHQRLGVRVVENHSVGVLHQARGLLIGGFVKALLLYPDPEGTSRQLGALFQGPGIGLRCDLHLGQVRIQPHAIPTRGLQVLGGAHKGPGPVMHGFAQGAEVSARLRRQEDERLLRLLGNRNKYALTAGTTRPGFDAGEPVVWRRIGGPAQEGDDQNKVGRLAFGQIGMDPEPVSGHQVGGLADGQGDVAPFDVHIHLWSGEVKSRAIGMQRYG